MLLLKTQNLEPIYLLSYQYHPLLKKATHFKKIKSFSYSLSSRENRLSSTNNEFNTISNSVLTSGNWYRFYVVKSGVYRITKSFLSELGVNVDGVDPRKIKIYGNGGRMIPLENSHIILLI
jgi:hypothetical protein